MVILMIDADFKKPNRGRRIIQRLVFITLLIICLGLILRASSSSSWKEEVQLYDGSNLIIDRSLSRSQGVLFDLFHLLFRIGVTITFQSGLYDFKTPFPVTEHEISFTIPDTHKTVTWESEYDENIGSTNFLLIRLDILNGTPYIAVKPDRCNSYNKWGRPNPPYLFFKYDDDWKQIPIKEYPAQFQTANVIVSLPPRDEKNLEIEKRKAGFVSVASVNELNRYLPPNLKTIDRTPMKDPVKETGCMEMVRTKTGWESTDSFKAPFPIEKPATKK